MSNAGKSPPAEFSFILFQHTCLDVSLVQVCLFGIRAKLCRNGVLQDRIGHSGPKWTMWLYGATNNNQTYQNKLWRIMGAVFRQFCCRNVHLDISLFVRNQLFSYRPIDYLNNNATPRLFLSSKNAKNSLALSWRLVLPSLSLRRHIHHLIGWILQNFHETCVPPESKDVVALNPLMEEQSRRVYNCDDQRLSGSTKC